MKTFLSLILGFLSTVAVVARAQTTAEPSPTSRVGLYDSRLVAYAFFSTPARQAEIRRQTTEGRAAKDRGDTARYEQLKAQIIAGDIKVHDYTTDSTCPL